MIKDLFKKYESIISYGFFGVLTTLVNIISYYAFSHLLHFSTVTSTVYAWIFAVTFALITNKIWVFKSKKWDKKTLIKETISFFTCRFLTGVLDVVLMYVFVDILNFNDVIIKTLSNILVIVLNYVASKLIIFNNKSKIDYKKLIIDFGIYLVILILAVIAAMESGLNMFNIEKLPDYDSSVFKSIGYFMNHGLMPYKDLFDHKGPIIYLINYFGQFISNGIWLFEIAFMFITILFLYKSARIYCNKIYSLIATIVVSSVIPFYFSGGNLTEEYALPFITVSLFIFLDYFKNEKINIIRLIICGMCFGCVFLLRVNMISLWFVFSLSVLVKCIKEKKYNDILKFIIWFLLGALIISIPIIIWLYINGAFTDFIKDYFMFNFTYSGYAMTYQKIESIIFFMNKYLILIAFIIILYLVYKKKDFLNITYLICFIVTLLFISMSGRDYLHYGLVIVPLLIYPISILFKMIKNKNNDNLLLVPLFLLCFIALPSWINTSLNSFRIYNNYVFEELTYKEDPVYLVSKYIKKNTNKNDKITVFGGKNNIYIISKRMPASKYTYQGPLIEVNSKIEEYYLSDLENNLPKMFVVTKESDKVDKFLNNHNYKLLKVYSNKPDLIVKLYTIGG